MNQVFPGAGWVLPVDTSLPFSSLSLPPGEHAPSFMKELLGDSNHCLGLVSRAVSQTSWTSCHGGDPCVEQDGKLAPPKLDWVGRGLGQPQCVALTGVTLSSVASQPSGT